MFFGRGDKTYFRSLIAIIIITINIDIVTDWYKSKTHKYILNQQSTEDAIAIHLLMCSFGND